MQSQDIIAILVVPTIIIILISISKIINDKKAKRNDVDSAYSPVSYFQTFTINSVITTFFKSYDLTSSIDRALISVIHARYPLSEANRSIVINELKRNIASRNAVHNELCNKALYHKPEYFDEDREKLIALVMTILFYEYPRLEEKCLFSQSKLTIDDSGMNYNPDLYTKIEEYISNIYDSMKK